MLRADGVRHDLLGLGDDTLGRGPVVEAAGGEDVGPEHVVTEDGPHVGVRASSLFVAGRRERGAALRVVGGQRVEYGCL